MCSNLNCREWYFCRADRPSVHLWEMQFHSSRASNTFPSISILKVLNDTHISFYLDDQYCPLIDWSHYWGWIYWFDTITGMFQIIVLFMIWFVRFHLIILQFILDRFYCSQCEYLFMSWELKFIPFDSGWYCLVFISNYSNH